MSRISEGQLDWEGEYRRLAPQLVRYAYRLLGDAEAAADLVHDSFLAAMRSASQLRDSQAFDSWLYRIVSNRVTSHLRRRRLIRFTGLSDREPAESSTATATQQIVRSALGRIPPDQAITLVLSYHEGFSRTEIAALTGVPPETVKTRLARGRKNFAEAYRRLEGDRPR